MVEGTTNYKGYLCLVQQTRQVGLPRQVSSQTLATASPDRNTLPHPHHNILLPALDLSFTAAHGSYISILANRTLIPLLKEYICPMGEIITAPKLVETPQVCEITQQIIKCKPWFYVIEYFLMIANTNRLQGPSWRKTIHQEDITPTLLFQPPCTPVMSLVTSS